MAPSYIKKFPRVSIGLGVTGNCNNSCPFCYSKQLRGSEIHLADVRALLAKFHIKSVNFGVGESCLNPDFREIIKLFWEHGSKISLTSNGNSILELEDDYS
jgi:MoaA/NifB/PqqE/SkfB family radical SAM enzyme